MPDVELDIPGAYNFYERFILNYTRDKSEVYTRYGFTIQNSIGSKDWEVFAAILLRDRAKRGDGSDLVNHEVKSASGKGSFEYQYHRNRGLAKLQGDRRVDHVFISRSPDYKDVEVWWVNRNQMQSIFDTWQPELEANYASTARQRFRRSVTYGFVKTHGICIFHIAQGQLVIQSERKPESQPEG